MGECKLTFTESNNGSAYQLYEELTEKGVSCSDLDSGYEQTNYPGLECPNPEGSHCTVGASNGSIEPQEVIEYAINRYNEYHGAITSVFGVDIPWVINDFDPSTEDDELLRQNIYTLLDEYKKTLHADGIVKGTEEYKEKLAIYCYSLALEFRMTNNQPTPNLTILESIRTDTGDCGEMSRVLFAIMKMAGLSPEFIEVKLISDYAYDHQCVGLEINGTLRLFDLAMLNPDAHYDRIHRCTQREALAGDFVSNVGYYNIYENDINKQLEYALKTVEIAPENPDARYALAGAFLMNEQWDEADANLSLAISADPNNPLYYALRVQIRTSTGDFDGVISDANIGLALEPNSSMFHLYRGLAWYNKGEWASAIADIKEYMELNLKKMFA